MKRTSIFVIAALLIGLFVGGAIHFGDQSSFAQTKMKTDTQIKMKTEDIVKIIKNKYPNATNIKVEEEKENGKVFYEAEFLDGKRECEVLLDANSGKILNQANKEDDTDKDIDNENNEDNEHEHEHENGEDDD